MLLIPVADRKASAIAMLIVMLALGAFVTLCSPGDLPPQSTPVVVELALESLPPRARTALQKPYFRDYANLGGRLPRRSAAYYREHAIEGAGPDERIVRGLAGEIYFTTDNFHSVIRVK